MGDRLRSVVYNAISAGGLARLPAQRYRVGKDVADPTAILVRSADLHKVDTRQRARHRPRRLRQPTTSLARR